MRSHPSSKLLKAYERGELSSEVEREILAHARSCPECRNDLPGLRSVSETSLQGEAPSSASVQAYSSVFDRVFHDVVEESNALEAERARAKSLLRELEGHALTQRRILVNNTSRYRSWALAEELLVQARLGWSEDPARSEEMASLGLEIAGSLSAEGFRGRLLNDLKAEAWAYIGNCRRIQSDFGGAAAAFRSAEEYLTQGTGDPMERARVLDLKASLLTAQRRFDGAADALAEGIRGYRRSSDAHAEGRALLKYANILYEAGRPEESISVLERAASLIDLGREPYLGFLVKWKLVLYLSELGRAEEAFRLMPEVRELARLHAPRLERVRLLWTEGLLRKGLGQTELAAEALKQVREGFIAAGIGYDVALVSLDLAALYLEAGRTAEVRSLAVETLPIFASRNVERELLIAWQLFREAAERDQATIALVNEVSERIRASREPAASGSAP